MARENARGHDIMKSKDLFKQVQDKDLENSFIY